MSQVQGTVITKDDIVNYIDKMNIKKSNIGGLDKIDVYVHIQEIIRMYGVYAEQELGKQREAMEIKHKEQVADLMHYKEHAVSLQDEIETQQKRIEYLKESETLQEELHIENETLKRENRAFKRDNEAFKQESEMLNQELKEQKQGSEILNQELKEQKQGSEILNQKLKEQNQKNEILNQELKEQNQKNEILNQELKEQNQKNEILNQELKAQKQENKELKETRVLLPELQDTTKALNKKVRELIEELDECKAYAQELEKKTQTQRTEINELNQYKGQAMELQYEVQRQKDETEGLIQYKETVADLQRKIQEQEQQQEQQMTERQQKEQQMAEEQQGYEAMIMKLQAEADGLRKEAESLHQSGLFSEKQQEELESRTKEILELKGALQMQTAETQELKHELQSCQESLTEYYPVRVSEDMQQELRKQEQMVMEREQRIQALVEELRAKEKELESRKEAENAAQSMESYNYGHEIGDILQEARREGESIIDNARVEAEQEMIRLLNLRATYKQEKEVYRSWCKRVETEKRTVEEYLKKLSVQYEDVSRAFDSVREEAVSFDIKRTFRALDSQQINAEEADYEEKGLA